MKPPGRVVDIGGRNMHAIVEGRGGPAVVIETGAGNIALDWMNVVEGVSKFTTVIAYDRAGYGWSDPDGGSRTPTAVVRDLRRLMAALETPSPWILVGHSLGGLYVRRFAELFPTVVAGLVLVDSSHPDQQRRLPPELTSQVRRLTRSARNTPPLSRAAIRAFVKRTYPDLSRSQIERLVTAHVDPRKMDATRREVKSAFGSRGRIGSRPLPRVPLVVISGLVPGLSDESAAVFRKSFRALHEELAELLPGGRLVNARKSGHMINYSEPGVIVRSIREMVKADRIRSRQ